MIAQFAAMARVFSLAGNRRLNRQDAKNAKKKEGEGNERRIANTERRTIGTAKNPESGVSTTEDTKETKNPDESRILNTECRTQNETRNQEPGTRN